jgi:hypothetical protein
MSDLDERFGWEYYEHQRRKQQEDYRKKVHELKIHLANIGIVSVDVNYLKKCHREKPDIETYVAFIMLGFVHSEYCFDDIRHFYNMGIVPKELFDKTYKFAKKCCFFDVFLMCQWSWKKEVNLLHKSTYLTSEVKVDIALIKLFLRNGLQGAADAEFFKTKSLYSANQLQYLDEYLKNHLFRINTFDHLDFTFLQISQPRYVFVEMPSDEPLCIGENCS